VNRRERSTTVNGFFAGALGALTVLVTAAVARRAAWRRFARHRRFGARRVLRHIGATPEQERAVLAETDALAEVLRELRGDGRALRGDLADLLAAPALDAAKVTAALEARLARAAEVKRRLAEGIARVHAALGPEQRARLAALVREGPHGGCRRARPAAA
jgi:Spy/CpxP family protein refolding chaperone